MGERGARSLMRMGRTGEAAVLVAGFHRPPFYLNGPLGEQALKLWGGATRSALGAPRPRRSAISGAHNHNVNRGERGGVVVGVTSWPNRRSGSRPSQ